MKKFILSLIFTLCLITTSFAQKHTADHYDHAIRQAFTEERWDAGKYMIDEAEPYYGDLATFYDLKGWYFYHKKDYIQSRYMLSKCLELDDFNTHAKTLLSKVEEETGHYASSICYINELLEDNAYDKTLWLRKIEMYRKLNNDIEADKLLTRLAEIYPEDITIKGILDEQLHSNYKLVKSKNDTNSQLSIAKDLVKMNPTADNYLLYVNTLLSAGYLSDALEVAGEGAKKTNSQALIKKRCDILCEQGKYTEAINYVSSIPSARSLKAQIEKEQTYVSTQYDPYIMYQKLYSKVHSEEAFNFIVNTALSRGYYYDAIDFINDYKKRGNINTDILYKEYTAYKRLGNIEKSTQILDEISRRDSTSGVEDELCEGYYAQARTLMNDNEFKEAIEKLEYITIHSNDPSLVKSAAKSLYTCYMNTNELDKALAVLDETDYSRRADILSKQGKYKQALSLVSTNDSTAYTEMSIVYIKELLANRKYDLAYAQANEALVVTDAKEIYMYAISSGSRIGKDVSNYITAGVEKYPTDEYFINQYCGLLNKESLSLYKSKKYDDALLTVNTGLEYNPEDKELLNTKGLIYEKMKQYDLAYNYQKSYQPSALEEYSYVKKMQGMQARSYRNAINVMYEYNRTESVNRHQSQASINYSHKGDKNSFEIITNYTAREDATEEKEFLAQVYGGGPAIQFGGSYTHEFKYEHSLTATLLGGFKYYPLIVGGLSMTKGLKNDWSLTVGLKYKGMNSYTSGMKTYNNIFDLTLGASKTLDPFVLGNNIDLFLINNKFYMNTKFMCDYFPIEGNQTKIFARVGFGTAPEMTADNSLLPIRNDKINVYLNIGGAYYMNSNVGIGLAGSWYSVYDQIGEWTKYTNLYYIHANLIVRF